MQIRPGAAPESQDDTARGDCVVVAMDYASEGAVDVYVEPHLPHPRLLVAGDTPVAAVLARIAEQIPYDVVRVVLEAERRSVTARNLDPNDAGRDLADYGVVHRITFTLINPTDDRTRSICTKTRSAARSRTFLVDGQPKELGCARLPQPYWITTYQLPPHATGATTTVTMTDGGSFYPVEFGVTETQRLAYTTPVGSPDGCSPTATRSAQPSRS